MTSNRSKDGDHISKKKYFAVVSRERAAPFSSQHALLLFSFFWRGGAFDFVSQNISSEFKHVETLISHNVAPLRIIQSLNS